MRRASQKKAEFLSGGSEVCDVHSALSHAQLKQAKIMNAEKAAAAPAKLPREGFETCKMIEKRREIKAQTLIVGTGHPLDVLTPRERGSC